MTIDMHAHWFPETLADAFRKRTSKPRIYTKEDGKEYLEGTFPAAPLRLESLDTRLSEMDRTGVELGILSLSPVTGIEGLSAEESVPLCASSMTHSRRPVPNILVVFPGWRHCQLLIPA